MGHLEDVKMTYTQHLANALWYSFYSFSAGIIFFVHGLCPNYFITMGSTVIENLNVKLQANKKHMD